jgi:hypothetical protein
MIPNRYTKQYITECGGWLGVQNWKTNTYHLRSIDNLWDWEELVRTVADGGGATGQFHNVHNSKIHTTVVLG